MNTRKNSRKRGAMLADAIFAIAILMSVGTYLAYQNRQEELEQQDRMMASSMEMVANASKAYVAERYDSIREDMVSGTGGASDSASLILSMEDLASAGYIPNGLFSDTASNIFNHDYRLFVRGVLRSDPTWPQATLTRGEIMAANSPDAFGNPRLINGLYDAGDDELDIEAVLLSEGGEPIPLRRGNNITGYSGNPTMAFVREQDAGDPLIASGNLGSFQMPLQPWTDLGSTATAGSLMTLVSLSDGVMGFGGNGDTDLRGALRRCEDLETDSERQSCLADGNNMYSNIVFSTGLATPDYDDYPGIEGLKKIACRDPNAAGRPVGADLAASDIIYIDCGEVRLSDNLTVEGGDINVQNGDINVSEGDLNIDNGTINLNGNEISNNLIMAYGRGMNGSVLPASPVTEQCPLRPDGSRMEYRVQAWVDQMIEPVGRPISGHRTSWRTASSERGMSLPANPDPASGQFVIDVISFVNEDFCANVVGSELRPNNAAGGMDEGDFTLDGTDWIYDGPMCAAGGTRRDNKPDAYFLNDGQATVQYAIYCE